MYAQRDRYVEGEHDQELAGVGVHQGDEESDHEQRERRTNGGCRWTGDPTQSLGKTLRGMVAIRRRKVADVVEQ